MGSQAKKNGEACELTESLGLLHVFVVTALIPRKVLPRGRVF